MIQRLLLRTKFSGRGFYRVLAPKFALSRQFSLEDPISDTERYQMGIIYTSRNNQVIKEILKLTQQSGQNKLRAVRRITQLAESNSEKLSQVGISDLNYILFNWRRSRLNFDIKTKKKILGLLKSSYNLHKDRDHVMNQKINSQILDSLGRIYTLQDESRGLRDLEYIELTQSFAIDVIEQLERYESTMEIKNVCAIVRSMSIFSLFHQEYFQKALDHLEKTPELFEESDLILLLSACTQISKVAKVAKIINSEKNFHNVHAFFRENGTLQEIFWNRHREQYLQFVKDAKKKDFITVMTSYSRLRVKDIILTETALEKLLEFDSEMTKDHDLATASNILTTFYFQNLENHEIVEKILEAAMNLKRKLIKLEPEIRKNPSKTLLVFTNLLSLKVFTNNKELIKYLNIYAESSNKVSIIAYSNLFNRFIRFEQTRDAEFEGLKLKIAQKLIKKIYNLHKNRGIKALQTNFKAIKQFLRDFTILKFWPNPSISRKDKVYILGLLSYVLERDIEIANSYKKRDMVPPHPSILLNTLLELRLNYNQAFISLAKEDKTWKADGEKSEFSNQPPSEIYYQALVESSIPGIRKRIESTSKRREEMRNQFDKYFEESSAINVMGYFSLENTLSSGGIEVEPECFVDFMAVDFFVPRFREELMAVQDYDFSEFEIPESLYVEIHGETHYAGTGQNLNALTDFKMEKLAQMGLNVTFIRKDECYQISKMMEAERFEETIRCLLRNQYVVADRRQDQGKDESEGD